MGDGGGRWWKTVKDGGRRWRVDWVRRAIVLVGVGLSIGFGITIDLRAVAEWHVLPHYGDLKRGAAPYSYVPVSV